MNILLTFDYELFFGSNPGSQEKCIITPTEQLLKLADKHGVPMCFFVDAGYLVRMAQEASNHPRLKEQKQRLHNQLQKLIQKGHEVQLHVHPHWEDTRFDGAGWQMNLNRYKLADFPAEHIDDIVSRYKKELEGITQQEIFAYRAGGWSIQPFSKIKNALLKNGIRIDSTIYPGGYYASSYQSFDFREAPPLTQWQFEDDPCQQLQNGSFWEIPISSLRVSPLFYWRLALSKISQNKKHLPYGDGSAAPASKKELLQMLTKRSISTASTDGYKAALLPKALHRYQKLYGNDSNFVTIGHPKAVTPFSLGKLATFVQNAMDDHQFLTYRQFLRNG